MQETPHQYIQRITGYVGAQDPLSIQGSTIQKLTRLLKRVPKRKLMTRPKPDKWSVAEVLAHLADSELVAAFRMRLIMGLNGTPIKAFDQDVWAENFDYRKRDPKKSFEMFRMLRESNLSLLRSVPTHLWDNYGMHEERGRETIHQVVKMFAGHDLNHLAQIKRIVEGEV